MSSAASFIIAAICAARSGVTPGERRLIANFKKALADTGLEMASGELTTIGATDYSATVSRLKTANPDAVFLFGAGVDPGYFMKQYVAAGLTAPVIGRNTYPTRRRSPARFRQLHVLHRLVLARQRHQQLVKAVRCELREGVRP
ncbi:MAG TPA: ABC transporter substrate-binding protein [Roseiarcus sp.]|nr:ABC transporter substrate-binding protein [Roseiarcus sp.]